MNKRPDKASKMISYLEERIVGGVYSAGDRLPSIRSLMRKFNLSYGTTRRGISYLLGKTGKMEKIPCKGIYFHARPEHSPLENGRTLAIFHSPTQEKSGLYYTALKSISAHAEKDGFSLRLFPLAPAAATEELIQHYSLGCDGIIFLQEYDSVLNSLRINIPSVGIMMENSFNGTISTVNLDYWSAAEMAVDYFMRHKIRTVLISGSREQVYLKRGRTFSMLWKEKGFRCRTLSAAPVRFQKGIGYFFTSDSWAHSCSFLYEEKTGHMLSEDHIIMGMDGKQLLTPVFHHFPSIVVNWESIGTAAYMECVSRINDPGLPPKKIYFRGWCMEERDEQKRFQVSKSETGENDEFAFTQPFKKTIHKEKERNNAAK